MSINIKVYDSMISIKKKGISLVDYQIEKKKSKKRNKELSTGNLELPTNKPSEKVDEKRMRTSGSRRKNDIVKKKATSMRNLMKFEKKYKHLEKICSEYISPRDNQNKSLLETNNLKPTRRSESTLLEFTQQFLKLEEEANTVLISRSSRLRNDYNCNNMTNDGCEIIDFLLKFNKLKKTLLDEFDLNVSGQVSTDDSQQLENRLATNNSSGNSDFQKSSNDVCGTDTERTTTIESVSSRLDKDEQMIDMLTEEILTDLKKSNSKISFNREMNHLDECKQINSSTSTSVLSDIPKILPSFSRNSLLHREKPPANLICKQYKRLDIDFTIHELSVIYETDSDVSNSETTIPSLK